MKSLATLSLALLAALTLASCTCNRCGAYNPDYLRDVPVTHSQSFD